MEADRGYIILYQSKDGGIAVDVCLTDDTVWLNQAQMTKLFQRNKRTVSEHIRNVFKEGELKEESVVRKFRTTANDGKNYQTNFYNLDVIISVGYIIAGKARIFSVMNVASVLPESSAQFTRLSTDRISIRALKKKRPIFSILL